ncbi:MAG: Ig-like domain-containing protein [Myxococcota bacterium]
MTRAAPVEDLVAPRVIATSPAADTADVGLNTIVSVVFNENIDAASMTTASFTIDGVAGAVSLAGAVATFVADAPFGEDTLYYATVVGSLRDLAGNAMGSDYTWSFRTTSNGQDTTPPIVVSTDPAAGAVDVALNSTISATFSEVMDASSINSSTFSIDGGLTGSVSYDGATATFTPDTPMSWSNTYTATISTDVTDLAGLPLSQEFSWSFSTGEPAIANLTWNPVTTRIDSSPVSVQTYRVYFGSTSRHDAGFSGYDHTQHVSSDNCDTTACTAQVSMPAPGTYYFAVKAIDASGLASDYSPDEPSRLY